MVRSHGGWAEVKRSQSLVKGDERILGDTSFVMGILADVQEKIDRRTLVKQSGMNLAALEKRVTHLSMVNFMGRVDQDGSHRHEACSAFGPCGSWEFHRRSWRIAFPFLNRQSPTLLGGVRRSPMRMPMGCGTSSYLSS